MGKGNIGCVSSPAKSVHLAGLIESAASLLPVDAVEVWAEDAGGSVCRVDCRYRSMRPGTSPPWPNPAMHSLAARLLNEKSQQSGATTVKLDDIRHVTGLPFEAGGHRCVLLLLSFAELRADSETLLRAQELLSKFVRSVQ